MRRRKPRGRGVSGRGGWKKNVNEEEEAERERSKWEGRVEEEC